MSRLIKDTRNIDGTGWDALPFDQFLALIRQTGPHPTSWWAGDFTIAARWQHGLDGTGTTALVNGQKVKTAGYRLDLTLPMSQRSYGFPVHLKLWYPCSVEKPSGWGRLLPGVTYDIAGALHSSGRNCHIFDEIPTAIWLNRFRGLFRRIVEADPGGSMAPQDGTQQAFFYGLLVEMGLDKPLLAPHYAVVMRSLVDLATGIPTPCHKMHVEVGLPVAKGRPIHYGLTVTPWPGISTSLAIPARGDRLVGALMAYGRWPTPEEAGQVERSGDDPRGRAGRD